MCPPANEEPDKHQRWGSCAMRMTEVELEVRLFPQGPHRRLLPSSPSIGQRLLKIKSAEKHEKASA